MSRREFALVTVALAVAVTAVGCGSGKPEPRKPTAAEEKVRDAYLAYWAALLQANEKSDAELPQLLQRAAGEQLTVAQSGIERSKKDGIVAKGTVGHDVREIGLTGSIAYVVDCVDLREWTQYNAGTDVVRPGQLRDRPPTLGRFTLAQRDGSWLVTQTREIGSC